MFAALFGLAPFFLEEQTGTTGRTRAASAAFLRERAARDAQNNN
jgi:hypothetical protein